MKAIRYSIILFFSLCTSLSIVGQDCPDDPEDLLINTQEKFDYFFENYPNCKEYTIVKMDGKFMGAPRFIEYCLSFILSIGILLAILKYIFRNSETKKMAHAKLHKPL